MFHRLAQADLRRTAPGLYADGGNLYLQVTVNGETVNRSWIFRFAINGKRREMGLGAVHTIGLKDARSTSARHLTAGHTARNGPPNMPTNGPRP